MAIRAHIQQIDLCRSFYSCWEYIFFQTQEQTIEYNKRSVNIKHRGKPLAIENFVYSILRELISRVFSCNLKIFRDIISHNCPGTL